MHVYVFGLGHIGLPMAIWIALNGYQVNGIDINPSIIEDIQNGTIKIQEYFEGVHISKIALNLINKKQLSVSTEFQRKNNEPSIYIVTVGIVDAIDGSKDISPVQSVLNTILPNLIENDLLLFRTTMIPGTCDKLVIPQLKTLNKKIYFAYAPETISETCAFEELQKNPCILAAIDEESYKIAKSFLQNLSNINVYRASTIVTAEMAKIIQNIARDVNIALINEISEITSLLGVDVYELRRLVNTHPRVELLLPGPGVGGYCLPNALKYLEEAFTSKKNAPLTLMQTARQLNDKRPQRIVNAIKQALKDVNKEVNGATIAIIGLAMKDYCADCRYSPALDIASLLINEGAIVRGYDPLVPIAYPFQVSSFSECIKNADCMVITAKQEKITFDVPWIREVMSDLPVIVDTRNIFPLNSDVKLYRV